MDSLDNTKKEIVYVVGDGKFLELGTFTRAEREEFAHMSPDAQKDFIYRHLKDIPDALKDNAGYCNIKKAHISLKNCLTCARGKGMVKKAEWDACKEQNLQKYSI